ncbi:MAG: acyltransferase [Sphingomonadaceae bacterium]|nr:acyltransferase [Sphingomonadaceae bacterium]
MTDRRPTLLSRITKAVVLWLFRLKGWSVAGEAPAARKFVITGAPHTTNWDFIFFIGTVNHLGLKPSFMGKVSLFKGPLKRFMYDMGGLPVDRSKRNNNYVEEAADHFERAEDLALVVAPEGTRGSDGTWRSGFYHIAMRAGVPIVPAWVNHATKKGGVGPAIMPTGDYAADLAKIAAFYRSVMPDCLRFQRLAASAAALKEAAAESLPVSLKERVRG